MQIEEEGFKNLSYNNNLYDTGEWELIKSTYTRRWLGIRFAYVSDDAGRTVPTGRIRRWIYSRDLMPALLPIMAVGLFCCAVIISVAGYVVL